MKESVQGQNLEIISSICYTNEALKDRVSIDRNNAEADKRQIAYAAWRAAADAFRMYPDNKQLLQ